MKLRLLTVITCIPLLTFAQQTITLEQCYQAAEANFPLNGQSQHLIDITDANLLKINAIWQPKVYINAQASYQSDVTGLPISFPGIEVPELSKDQYKATLDVSQILYDGGASAQQKAVAEQQLAVEEQKLVVDRYKVLDKVNQFYLAVMLSEARMELLSKNEERIRVYLEYTSAAQQFGVASEMQVLEFKAELLRIHQQVTEVRAMKQIALEALKVLTGLAIDDNATFTAPTTEVNNPNLMRPELELFNRQKGLFDLQRSFAEAPSQPTISLFAQGGYGRPGLNMLVDSFAFYYIGGIKLSYPLWTGNTRKRDASIYASNSAITDLQILNFQQSISMQSTQYQQDIIKYEQFLREDDSIITLRNMLIDGATLQFNEGAASSRDVIDYLHDQSDAVMAKRIHELQLTATKVNYLTLIGQR